MRVAAKSMSAYSVGGSWGPDSEGAGEPTATRQTGRDRLNVECELGGRLSSAYVRSSSRWSRVAAQEREKRERETEGGRKGRAEAEEVRAYKRGKTRKEWRKRERTRTEACLVKLKVSYMWRPQGGFIILPVIWFRS